MVGNDALTGDRSVLLREWNALCAQEDVAREQLRILEIWAFNFAETDEGRENRQQAECWKRRRAEIHEDLTASRRARERYAGSLADLWNYRERAVLESRRSERKKRLQSLKGLHVSRRTKRAQDLVAEVGALEEIVQQHAEQQAEWQPRVAVLMTQLAEVEEHLLKLDQEFRALRTSAKETVWKAERELTRIREAMLEWGTRDPEHLSCVLETHPNWKTETFARYRVRHPGVRLPEPAASPPVVRQLPQRRQGRSRRARTNAVNPPQVVDNPVREPQWTFTFFDEASREELLLPPGALPDQEKSLESVLKHRNMDVSARIVIARLERIAILPLSERQKRRKLYKDTLERWKIARVTRKWRLFFDVNEPQHEILFTLRRRTDAYNKKVHKP